LASTQNINRKLADAMSITTIQLKLEGPTRFNAEYYVTNVQEQDWFVMMHTTISAACLKSLVDSLLKAKAAKSLKGKPES
jgi:threonyl-tRNA synthetase